ncbi:MAG: J domain-containing protein [bacterium]|nr:J domain-containing protein [bacterium]
MTIQEACRILGVERPGDEKEIKLQFRRLMTKYHPDSVGTDAPEHIKRAQLINEAYAVLRNNKGLVSERVRKSPVWKGNVIKDAFTERVIFMQGAYWEEHKTEYYEVAKGKYEWDPDLEEFECLLRSLHQAVLKLLEQTEFENGIDSGPQYDRTAIRFEYQIQLFHLLARQFIPSVTCLRKLAEPETIDQQGRAIYKFQTFLGATGNEPGFSELSMLREGENLYVTSLKNNRIMISNKAGKPLGHLSFADDQFYYIVIPILQMHMAQVKFIVAKKEVHRRTRPYRVKVMVELYLRMETTAEEKSLTDPNKQITSILNQYASHIKKHL